jgi:hypothetical protein
MMTDCDDAACCVDVFDSANDESNPSLREKMPERALLGVLASCSFVQADALYEAICGIHQGYVN